LQKPAALNESKGRREGTSDDDDDVDVDDDNDTDDNNVDNDGNHERDESMGGERVTLPEQDEAELDCIYAEIETGILDVFGDAYCNRHLIYGILELVLVRLMPELTEKGVLELLSERVPSTSR